MLDGVRGLAVLLVILGHAYAAVGEPLPPWIAPVGTSLWIGVDLFFVLSGFLITGILFDTQGDPGRTRGFYIRRALRIVPLYVLVVLALLWVVPWANRRMPHPTDAPQLYLASLPYHLTFTSNIYFALFGLVGTSAFLHLWSLAVEEQFYLVWPQAIWRSRVPLATILGTLALAPALRLFLLWRDVPHHAVWSQFSLPTRMDGLALGAALAWAVRRPVVWARCTRWAPGVGLSAALFLVWRGWGTGLSAADPWMETAGYTVLALGAGSLLVLAQRANSVAARLFGTRGLRRLGERSYGLYLWHMPLIYLAGALGIRGWAWVLTGETSVGAWIGISVVIGLVSWGVAALSWHVLEAPALRLKSRWAPRTPH